MTPPRRPPRGHHGGRYRRDDAGESLVEVLMAIVILGLAAVAILGGLGLSLRTSDLQRKQTTAGSYARNYAEAIVRYLDADPAHWTACAPPSAYAPGAVGFAPPAGFTARVLDVVPLDGAGHPVNPTACPTGDTGLQRATLAVASDDDRATERLTVVLRRPCGPGVICDATPSPTP